MIEFDSTDKGKKGPTVHYGGVCGGLLPISVCCSSLCACVMVCVCCVCVVCV